MGRYFAPVLSALVVIVLAAGYAVFVILLVDGADVDVWVKVAIAAVSLFVVGGVAVALVSRIRELKGGLEDDLGEY